MSGTASRSQTRLTYSPALRVAPMIGALGMPGAPLAAPPVTPSALQAMAFPTPGYGAAPVPASVVAPVQPPVMAGSVPFRREDGAGGDLGDNAATMGGMAESAPSTGSVVGDAIGAGRSLGGFAAGLAFGGPTAPAVAGLGVMAAGFARAAGNERLAESILSAIGIDVSQPLGNPAQAGNTTGNLGGGANPAGGNLSDPGMTTDPATATGALSGSVAGGIGYGGSFDGLGNPTQGPTTENNFGDGGNNSGGGLNDSPGASSPGGDASQGMGSEAGATGGATGDGEFQKGGYTGHGGDGVVQADQPAGTVHEGEVVIPASQVARYGLDPLLMLARGQVPPSRLMALLRG